MRAMTPNPFYYQSQMRSSNITPTARIRSSMGDMTLGDTFDKFASPLNDMKLGLFKERVAYQHQE